MPVRLAIFGAVMSAGCHLPCGPAEATVERIIDGDTIVLTTGDHVRYSLIDSPEIHGHEDCFGWDAARMNAKLVASEVVDLVYDDECRDRYGRLLAIAYVRGLDVNAELVRRGYACARYASHDHKERYAELKAYQAEAKAHRRGLWAACRPLPPAC